MHGSLGMELSKAPRLRGLHMLARLILEGGRRTYVFVL